MHYSRKRPSGYPEISFLPFDIVELLAKFQHEMNLDSVGPVSITLQKIEHVAYICWEQGSPGASIFLHSLFNRPDVPQSVIEHVLRHELLHLKIPARVIDGKLVHHPPEFWKAEQAFVPWKASSWSWMVLAFWDVIKIDINKECIWVKKTWKKLQNHPYPSWDLAIDHAKTASSINHNIDSLMKSL